MARKKQHGTCALCLKNKELRRSHFLGRAIYALNRDGKDDPVMMTPQLITPTQRQLWCHLLCGNCEQRFSSHGESLIMSLVQRETEFALLDRLNVAMPFQEEPTLSAYSGSAIGIDTEQLAYYALSVLWRSGVRQWRTLKEQTTGVSLGVFEEPIRKYLVGEAPFPKNVVVSVWVCTDIGSRFNTFAPTASKGAPHLTYSLLVRGLWFHIVTGDNLPALLWESCCINSACKVIFKRDCTREVLHAGGHLMSTATVSPKLSTPPHINGKLSHSRAANTAPARLYNRFVATRNLRVT